MLRRMGPLQGVLKLIPGLGQQLAGADVDDAKLKQAEAIVLSMTPQERNMPHVIDGRRQAGGESHQDHLAAAVRSRRDRAPATLVGFFSKSDQGVFTHMGSKTHLHCVVTDSLSSGHVDRVDVPAGTTVKFPASRPESSNPAFHQTGSGGR